MTRRNNGNTPIAAFGGIHRHHACALGAGKKMAKANVARAVVMVVRVASERDSEHRQTTLTAVWCIVENGLPNDVRTRAQVRAAAARTRGREVRSHVRKFFDGLVARGTRIVFCMNRHNFPVGRIVLPPC
jgi:hypothetical protein